MKSYTSLAGRYLKEQRKRSILTVVGIVLSVALISALGTMGQSIQDNLLQRAIYENGSYHFAYSEADSKLYGEMKNNALLDRVGAIHYGQKTKLDDTFSIQVNEASEEAFELVPLHLQEGQWPQSPDEIVVEKWILPYLPGAPKPGGETELTGPDGKPHRYRISGILINSAADQHSASASAFTLMRAEKAASLPEMTLFMTFRPGVDISDHLPEFQSKSETFSANNRVLSYMGESINDNTNKALTVIFGTLIGLVVLSTAAVIYNAFHISVLERIRQFGLLRTLGATPRQIRNLVLREATTLALIGIPIGLLCGWGALWLVIWLMVANGFQILQMESFQLQWHNWIMGGSVAVGLVSVYLAAWLPARKASRVSPVEAVKGAGSIVQESVRRSRFPSLLQGFGIGGKMAAKNIRRNRTKFRITTFSVVVSVTLFIVFHYFIREMFEMTAASNEEDRIAFSVYGYEMSQNGTKSFVTNDMLKKIAALPGVDDVYSIYQTPLVNAWIPSAKINPDFSELTGINFETVVQGSESYQEASAYFKLYDAARFREAERYLVSGTTDPQKLDQDNAVVIVQTVKTGLRDSEKPAIMELSRLKVGDKLKLAVPDDYGAEKPRAKERIAIEVTVGGILSLNPFDARYQRTDLSVIATEGIYEKLAKLVPKELEADYPTRASLIGFDVALADGADAEPVREQLNVLARTIPNGRVIDVAANQKEARQFTLQMQIFVYGFLTVIGLIGSLNIVNTVQTNLLLRRREFGLLQAVGMTGGQLKRMATLEGVWMGLIGGFWGLVAGTAISYFLYLQLDELQGMPFQFPWLGALVACVFAFGVGLLSVQGPLRRMAKANLIDELREDG